MKRAVLRGETARFAKLYVAGHVFCCAAAALWCVPVLCCLVFFYMGACVAVGLMLQAVWVVGTVAVWGTWDILSLFFVYRNVYFKIISDLAHTFACEKRCRRACELVHANRLAGVT